MHQFHECSFLFKSPPFQPQACRGETASLLYSKCALLRKTVAKYFLHRNLPEAGGDYRCMDEITPAASSSYKPSPASRNLQPIQDYRSMDEISAPRRSPPAAASPGDKATTSFSDDSSPTFDQPRQHDDQPPAYEERPGQKSANWMKNIVTMSVVAAAILFGSGIGIGYGIRSATSEKVDMVPAG